MQGIDPRTSRMLSERSTIWATSPDKLGPLRYYTTTRMIHVFKKQIFACSNAMDADKKKDGELRKELEFISWKCSSLLLPSMRIELMTPSFLHHVQD